MKLKNRDLYRKLGLNISYYRKDSGLSQMQLAELLNISRTHMSRIENGDCAASLDLLFALSHVLKISMAQLFEFR